MARTASTFCTVSESSEDAPSIWPAYYDVREGREVGPMFLGALGRFAASGSLRRQAIDLGAGDGTDTEALLRAGWKVLAIDREEESGRRLVGRLPPDLKRNLTIETISFEDIELLPRADFIYSSMSLPFCKPEAFPRLWGIITSSLKRGGRIACHLLGDRDTYATERPDTTFFTSSQVELLFEGFKIEQINEIEEDGEAFSGPKHWHIFAVIARKKSRPAGSARSST
jgi:hypothetical protein